MNRKNRKTGKNLFDFLKNVSFQRLIALVVTFLALATMVAYQAAPKKYKLSVGDISEYDINAPRDIENKLKTLENAELKADEELEPVIVPIEGANDSITANTYAYFDGLGSLFDQVKNSEQGKDDPAALIKEYDKRNYYGVLARIPQDKLLALIADDSEITHLKSVIINSVLPGIKRKQLMEDDLEYEKETALAQLKQVFEDESIILIAEDLLGKVIVPNSRIDEEATEEQRNAFIDSYVKENPVIIYKDERIISKDDKVTKDKFEVLKELNYIDSEGRPDYLLYAAVFLLVFAMFFLTILYLRNFHKKLYFDKNAVMLVGVSILITSLFAMLFKEFIPDYAPLIIPTLIAPVLTAIFLGIQPAISVNLLLTFSYALMLGGNIQFIFMSLISGAIAPYLTVNATQRRKISLAGLMLGGINLVVVVLMGILEKKSVESLLNEGGLAFVNGIFSIILAIGILPFLESAFNIITPMKLLELADPNHPLLKRLLLEAAGTYHHSLMVGNLAEVATREIGGNSLLSRVGAYYHDIGKLKRPHYFKENQMAENPHDNLAPSMSSRIITSHTRDGEELAIKYKLPRVIRDMIVQHHGTTIMVYFYHMATQNGNTEELNEDDFKYQGPLPDTREAAVVMLADSVEAAVRSIPDKTREKIEGLVRKIIKDKLDDGQLDRCDLTLKELTIIAQSFIQVLSGIFHERPEYPEVEKKNELLELDNSIYNLPRTLKKEGAPNPNGGNSLQPAEKAQPPAGNNKPS
ncbi:MAG: HDIG domain-containing protein [Clostridiaceae bacterium]|nr:HDIG domain-containing protein [Clostridiaceae bacterium]